MVNAHALCPSGPAAIQNDNNSTPPSLLCRQPTRSTEPPLKPTKLRRHSSTSALDRRCQSQFVAVHHRFLHSGRFTDVEKAVDHRIRRRGRGFPEAQKCGKAADCRYLEVPTSERARSVFHIVTLWSHRHFVTVDNLHAKRSPGRSQTDRRSLSGNLRADNLIVHKRNATPDFCTQHSALSTQPSTVRKKGQHDARLIFYFRKTNQSYDRNRNN